MVKRGAPKKRTYDASKRRERAEASRMRILDVAQALFSERGYAATTMDAIAGSAAVAVPTLYAAFGSKHGLLTTLLNTRVSGEPRGESVLKTKRAREVFAEPDRRRSLAMFAEHMSVIQDRVAPTYGVMKDAAAREPDIAELYTRAQSSRYANHVALAENLSHGGPFREGMTTEDVARTIWVLTSIEARQLLAKHAGWTRERYASWLATVLSAALVPS
jgi:AcrR family transcriptional regulator